MNFTIDNTQLAILQNNFKKFSYVENVLTRTFFKVENNLFTIMFSGPRGAMTTTIVATSSAPTSIYFSVDYSKWCNTLNKFNNADSLKFSYKKNALTVSTPNSSDVIGLGIVSYEKDSPEALVMNSFISSKKEEIIKEDFQLNLSEELLENFQLVDSLFAAQGKVNSIGLSSKEIIYSDRSVVLKIHLLEKLNESIFKSVGQEEYIFIHNYFLKLFPLLAKTCEKVYFSEDYDTIYWEDSSSKLLMTSENKELALPNQEQWEAIKPHSNTCFFEMDLDTLSAGLNFFTGFYEETAWKPITFNIQANDHVFLYYKHPTTEINKILPGVSCSENGNFLVSSDILSKIINKICTRFSPEEKIEINFDDEAPGIYCRVNDIYEFVLSKLVDA